MRTHPFNEFICLLELLPPTVLLIGRGRQTLLALDVSYERQEGLASDTSEHYSVLLSLAFLDIESVCTNPSRVLAADIVFALTNM